MPKVSVILPSYNAEKSLEKAVRSVLAQSFSDLELICVDDGSTDKSPEILKTLAGQDDRLVTLRQQTNRGVGQARSIGLAQAQGDYLMFLDADDSLLPGAVEHCLRAAEDHDADIVSFKLGFKVSPATEPPIRPPSLSDRYCHDFWARPFQWQDTQDTIFQLGVGLNNSFFRTAFVKGEELAFGSQRTGEWLSFVNMALVTASRIALLDKVLYHAGWWQGANLTQATLGNPKRYYQQLLGLKEGLDNLGILKALEQSYVNYAAQIVVTELEAQRGFAAYTDAAKFYQVYGFDALGIIGFPERYYYDPAVHAKLRRVVLGSVYSTQEQLVLDLQVENRKLLSENKGLTKAKEKLQRRLDRGLARHVASKAVRTLRNLFLSKSPDNAADATGRKSPESYRLNASTGYRFAQLCDQLTALDGSILSAHRQRIAKSIRSHKNGIGSFLIYGEQAISSSNKAYLSLLDSLLSLLQDTGLGTPALTSGIQELKDAAAQCTRPTVSFVFNLEKQQVFPALESTFLASQEDSRIDSAIVLAPLGTGTHSWDNSDAPLFDKNGQVAVRQKNEYRMFEESPDVLLTARPYLNSPDRPYGYDKRDRFEIRPAAESGFRTVYLPYAFFDTISAFSVKYGYQYTLQPVAWKIIAYSEQILGNFKKYSHLEGRNAVLLGAPRCDVSSGINGFRRDNLTEQYEARIRGRRTLFWNSHFRTARGSGQQLLGYLEAVLKYFTEHEDLVLFWRPHPMMFAMLMEQDVLTQREVDALRARIGNIENIIFDQSADYINAFALSHAMLTDGDSSLPYEYIATGKPVYIHYIYGWSENVAVAKYKNHIPLLYYRNYSIEGLIGHFDSFARGEDPSRGDRLEKAARFIHNNDGRSGERVKDFIVDELFKDEESLARSIIYPAGSELRMRKGLRIRPEDGLEEPGAPAFMATPLFYEAFPGDRLTLTDESYVFSVACYAPEVKAEWLHTDSLPPNQSWTVFCAEAEGRAPSKGSHEFSGHVYFRVSMQRQDHRAISWEDTVADVIRFDALPREGRPVKGWIVNEVNRVTQKLQSIRDAEESAFIVLGDAHRTVNGTWGDTATALQMVCEKAKLDGIVCLGDFTDGSVTLDALREYVSTMLDDLQKTNLPLDVVLGEHDSNSLYGNPEPLSLFEQSQLYLGRQQPRYYRDIPKRHLRLIFLDSYDPSYEQPFGYSDECLEWLRCTLSETPRARRIIVFSHIPPLARLQCGATELRGEQALADILRKHSHQILAFINGHTHTDNLDNNESFPIVSIASAKCESIPDGKPEGSVTPTRTLDHARQECWDIMLVNTVQDRVRFIRFGAGKDRILEGGGARWA
jgi:CDP-glycerol glycerophosphotransferase (TagB/SpsB family)